MHSPSIMIKAPNIMVNTLSITIKPKAGERGGQGGGQNTWGPDWLGGPEILVKRLVMGATFKMVGSPLCVITCLSWGPTLALAS